jgi:dipeptidyl aminopeptidase/acylaminoacyl peptidase
LFAIPFDLDKLETIGNAVPVLDDVKVAPNIGVADLSFSSNGTLVYRKGGSGVGPGQSTVQWISTAGKRSPLMAKAGVYGNFRLSPDTRRLAMQITEGGSLDVWVYDVQRGAPMKLTFGGGISADPLWTPDGRFVIFSRAGTGIFWTRADGAGQPQLLIEGKGILIPWSMSTPDGKRLAFFEVGKADGWIYTVEITQDGGALKAGKPERFFESKFADVVPEFSPDGRWIAYSTNESGRDEVVVRAFPAPASGQGGKWLVSTNGGTLVRWSRNSRELLYQEGDRLMAVSYTVNGDSFVADKPRVRIEKLGGTTWDVAPDGRIAILTPVESAQAPSTEHTVVFLQNFFDELRRKAPLGK